MLPAIERLRESAKDFSDEPIERLFAAGGDFHCARSGTQMKVFLPLPEDLKHPVHFWMSSETDRPDGASFEAWIALAVDEAFAKLNLRRARKAARKLLASTAGPEGVES